MPHLFILLLKINLVLILFAAAYYFVLRRLTFYVINRVFLVLGILFSTIYPFIDLTDFFHNQDQLNKVATFVPRMNAQVTEFVPSNFITNNWQLISLFFYLGVLFMAIRLSIQFVSLYIMHRKSKPGSVADYKVRILNEPVSPFSFWQTVYVNPSLHQERELQTILEHEHIHVKEWHSLDIILAELSVVFYWFNPGVWLMKRAVKENLEFITDEKILKRGVDKKTYQYSLLDVGNLTPAVAIVNNFNLSDLKKRIKMMNVKRSSRLTLSFYLLLPILLLTTLAFTITKKEINQHLKPLKQVLVNANIIDDVMILPAKVAIEKPVIKSQKSIATIAKAELDSTDKIKIFIKGDSTPIVFAKLFTLKTEFVKRAIKDVPLGTEQQYSFEYPVDSLVSNDGEVHKVKNIKLQFSVKGERLPDAKPPTSSSEVIKVVGYGTKSITPAVAEPKKVIFRGVSTFKEADSIRTVMEADYVLNGKKVTIEEINKLDPNNIKAVSVHKGTNKVAGIMIVTKKQ